MKEISDKDWNKRVLDMCEQVVMGGAVKHILDEDDHIPQELRTSTDSERLHHVRYLLDKAGLKQDKDIHAAFIDQFDDPVDIEIILETVGKDARQAIQIAEGFAVFPTEVELKSLVGTRTSKRWVPMVLATERNYPHEPDFTEWVDIDPKKDLSDYGTASFSHAVIDLIAEFIRNRLRCLVEMV